MTDDGDSEWEMTHLSGWLIRKRASKFAGQMSNFDD